MAKVSSRFDVCEMRKTEGADGSGDPKNCPGTARADFFQRILTHFDEVPSSGESTRLDVCDVLAKGGDGSCWSRRCSAAKMR